MEAVWKWRTLRVNAQLLSCNKYLHILRLNLNNIKSCYDKAQALVLLYQYFHQITNENHFELYLKLFASFEWLQFLAQQQNPTFFAMPRAPRGPTVH